MRKAKVDKIKAMKAEGYLNVEIAEAVGCHPSSIRSVLDGAPASQLRRKAALDVIRYPATAVEKVTCRRGHEIEVTWQACDKNMTVSCARCQESAVFTRAAQPLPEPLRSKHKLPKKSFVPVYGYVEGTDLSTLSINHRKARHWHVVITGQDKTLCGLPFDGTVLPVPLESFALCHTCTHEAITRKK